MAENGARMDHIINIDTNALLRTLRDLETKLSDQYRQDTIPSWAYSILPRLEHLETQIGRYKSVQAATELADQINSNNNEERTVNNAPRIHLEDLAQEQRIFDRMREEIDTQNGAIRLSLESKVSSLTMELDRVHKLLQIRPTTSELQKVMLAVHENDLRIQRVVSDMSSSVKSLVQDKLADEMSTILERMKVIERINEQGSKNLFRKVDGFSNDVSNLKLGVENSLGVINSQVSHLKETSNQSMEDVLQFRAEVEANNRRLQSSMIEGHSKTKELSDLLSEHKLFTQEKVNSLQFKLEENQSTLNEILRLGEERETSLRNNLSELRATLDEFKAMYQLDVDDVRSTSLLINDSLTSVRTRQEDIERYIRALKDVDVLNRVPALEERILQEEKKIAIIDKEVTGLSAVSKVAGKSIIEMTEILATLPSQIETERTRVTDIDKDLKDSKEFTKRLQTALKETQIQMEELACIRDEVAVVREIANNQEQLLKSQQTSIEAIVEATDENDRKQTDLERVVKMNEDKITRKVDDVRKEVMVAMVDKQQDIEHRLQVIKDNIDISVANDVNSGGGGNRFGGASSVGSSELNVTVLTKEEQRAITTDRAQFVAELCMNFEDIAVRKTSLPELPETICEHLAATAQSFTSFAATCADGDAIQQMLRGRPEDISYDDVISERRNGMIRDFMSIVQLKVEANNPSPGIVRAEAREKFLKQLRRAMDVAMSKHDQVILTSNSRLGRVKIPTCIACDRPLVNKVRQDSPIIDDNLSYSRGGPPSVSLNTSAGSVTIDDNGSVVGGANKYYGGCGRSVSPSNSSVKSSKSKLSGPVRLPAPKREVLKSRGSSVNGDGHSSVGGVTSVTEPEHYVLRGGFKMPVSKPTSVVTGNPYLTADSNPFSFPEIPQMSRSTGLLPI